MKVAELFVLLGIKGTNETQRSLKSVGKGLSTIKSTSLGVKAGIAGVVYGLEKMMRSSAKAGAQLNRFGTFTGLSVAELQRWQYAAKGVSVSNEDVTQSIKNVQRSMSNMLLGKGAPEGLNIIGATVGLETAEEKLRDTFYIMKKLQEFAAKAPADIGNSILGGMGINEGMIVAMRRNAFSKENLAGASIISNGDIKKLEKINVEWAKLHYTIKKSMMKLNSKFGAEIAGELTSATRSVVALVASLAKLSASLHVFKSIDKIIKGWSSLSDWTNHGVGKIQKKTDSIKSWSNVGFKGIGGALKQSYHESQARAAKRRKAWDQQMFGRYYGKRRAQTQAQVQINQNLNFKHEGKNSKQTADAVRSAANQASQSFNKGQEE